MMRRSFYLLVIAVAVMISSSVALAASSQQDRLEGRWEGTVQSPAGDSKAIATFKKSGDTYTGTMSWLRGDGDFSLRTFKLEADKITANNNIEITQDTLD